MICIICKGDGVVKKKEQLELCPNCEGSGEIGTGLPFSDLEDEA